jgi:hypothetical protein
MKSGRWRIPDAGPSRLEPVDHLRVLVTRQLAARQGDIKCNNLDLSLGTSKNLPFHPNNEPKALIYNASISQV